MTEVPGAWSLRLRLSVSGDTDVTEPGVDRLGDFVVRLRGDARVSDLADALMAQAGLHPDAARGSVDRCRLHDGTVAGPDEVLADLPIAHGDHLVFLPARRGARWRDEGSVAVEPPVAPVVLELVPVTGDGAPIVLTAGRLDVGRSRSDNDVVIDDPSVSRRHARFEVGAEVVVSDRGSSNGTTVDGTAVVTDRVVTEGAVMTFGDVEMTVRAAGARPAARPSERASNLLRPPEPLVRGHRVVNRPPRITIPVATVTLRAPEPPPPPMEHRLPWLSALVPVGLAGIVVLVSLVGSSGAGLGGGYALLSGVFLLMGPVMIVASYWESKRATRRSQSVADATFRRALSVLRQRVGVAVAEERSARDRRHGGPDELMHRAVTRDHRLWEVAGGGLTVRLGTARLRSSVSIERSTVGTGAHEAAIDEVRRFAESIDAVPVVLDVDTMSGLAVVGPEEWRTSVARWLVLQVATTVPPSTLRIDVVSDDRATWAWVAWLPQDGPRERAGTRLVVVDGTAPDQPAEVARLAALGAEPGGVLVWLGDDRTAAPSWCDVVLDPTSVQFAASGAVIDPVAVDTVDAAMADRWARALAPLVEAVPAGCAGTEVPASVGILDLLVDNDDDPEDLVDAVRRRWAGQPPSVTASLGRTATGPLEIDLRRDGPHGVIAGTTGAGKSELLQSLVVSMAANHPPSRVSFLLVDYKGGAAFGACAALPHTVGLVTDLDDGLVGRVLVSLGAEVRRREEILAANRAKDLAALERMGGDDVPPNLVILVDEFASIAAEVPEFMGGMIDIARRGRSLGVHLALATQRPAGVVSDQLRANANLRIALRVAEPADSTDVIGVPGAAAIERSMPGRAMARLGEGELVTFQTAYCGGRSSSERARSRAAAPVTLEPLCTDTPFVEAPVAAPAETPAEDAPTDLNVLVAAIRRAAALEHERRPRRPWLPPLPDVVPLVDLLEARDGVEECTPLSRLTIGLADDPARQWQGVAEIDLATRGSMLVYGADTADTLRALVVAATAGRLPASVRVDVVDNSSGSLASLEALPQTGSVVGVDDAERVGRLLRELDEKLREPPSRPARVLVIHDVIGFAANYDGLDGGRAVDTLARLVSEGAAKGVHVIASADRRIGVPLALASGVGCRVVSAMHGPDDVAGLAVDASLLGSVPGRAVVDGLVVQLAAAPRGATWDAFVVRERARCAGASAPAIGVLPNHVDLRDVAATTMGNGRSVDATVLVGLGDDDLAPVHLDLADGNVLVAGPLRSGRTSALAAFAATLPRDVGRVLVAARPTAWTGADLWDEVGVGADAPDLVERIRGQTSARPAGAPMVVFVDDATDLEPSLDDALACLAALTRDQDVRLVVAAEAALARVAYGGVVAAVRRSRRALLLQPDVELDGDLVGVRLRRRGRAEVPVGRGELVDRGKVTRVQVAFTTPSAGDGPHGRSATSSVR